MNFARIFRTPFFIEHLRAAYTSTHLLFENIKFCISNKFPLDITVGTIFQNRNCFQEKQRHFSLKISGNIQSLTESGFFDICVVITFKTKINFLLAARDLIFC